MMTADKAGHVHCVHCGHEHHFYGPCLPVPPGGAVLPPPAVVRGCINAPHVRAEADAARTAARPPRRPRGGS